nr:DUF4157 domain-containing protein [Haloterrigena salifodinae]
MEQFRDRQRERPAAVPTDIERQNNKSVQRSRGAHNESANAGDTQVPDSVRDVISSPGQPLEASIQRAMEERMGDSLGDVQIHTGPQAANACEDINARAFTVGNHIAFNHGEYDPESAGGQHVLAHELAHVRQQTGAAVSMLPQDQDGDLEIDPDPRLEREAEETADRVMRGGELGLFRMRKTEIHVQRMPDAERLEQAREQAAAESDHLTLAEEVSQIKDRLSSVEKTVAEESTPNGVGKAVTQGAVGAVGGLLGAVAGTMVSPGIGTIGGAAVGQEVAKGVAGDVTKTLTGKAYDKGSQTVSELAGKAGAQIEKLVEKTVKDLLSESEQIDDSQGVGHSRRE